MGPRPASRWPQGAPARREAGARFGRLVSVLAAVGMLGLFLYGLASAVPDRKATALEARGLTALENGSYRQAETAFAAVLSREPRSMHARFGLACAFFLSGHRSRAALELTLGLQVGLPLGYFGGCGHGVDLSRSFFIAKLDLANAFAAPRSPDSLRYEQMLVDAPEVSDEDDARRLLIGACLAFRARLDSTGWYYAANAVQRTRPDRALERDFFDCMGKRALSRLRCAPGSPLDDCALREDLRADYLRDKPHLHL